MSTPEQIKAVRESGERKKTMAHSVLPAVADETLVAMYEALDAGGSQEMVDALGVGLKRAFYEGARFGMVEAVGQVVEQGYDWPKITLVDDDELGDDFTL